MKEKKARVEDALNRDAGGRRGGDRPGGGVALLRASEALGSLKLSGDEATGSASCGALSRADPADRGERWSRGLRGRREGRRAFPSRAASTPRQRVVDMLQAGSSTRPRLSASPCRMRRRSRLCCSRPKRSSRHPGSRKADPSMADVESSALPGDPAPAGPRAPKGASRA